MENKFDLDGCLKKFADDASASDIKAAVYKDPSFICPDMLIAIIEAFPAAPTPKALRMTQVLGIAVEYLANNKSGAADENGVPNIIQDVEYRQMILDFSDSVAMSQASLMTKLWARDLPKSLDAVPAVMRAEPAEMKLAAE